MRDAVDGTLTDAEADGLYSEYLRVYQSSWTLFPDVLPCLDQWRGSRLGVISNGQPEHQRKKLERTNVAGRFE